MSGGALHNLTVDVWGSLDITGADTQTVFGSSLTLHGSTTWSGANNIRTINSLITNRGVFDVQTDQHIERGPGDVSSRVIAAAGVFKKTAGAGKATIHVPFEHTGGDLRTKGFDFRGTMKQTGGTTYLEGGTFAVADSFEVLGGTVTGYGTIEGGLKLAGGSLDLAGDDTTGTLTITGDYEQTPDGTLLLSIAHPGMVCDRLVIGGEASLGGVLWVSNLMWHIPLQVGDMFEVLTAAGGLSGEFDEVIYPAVLGYSLARDYGATALTLWWVED